MIGHLIRRPQARHRTEIAIYAPSAHLYYEKEPHTLREGGGGAEIQTTRLAAGLAERGRRTAHIVYPVEQQIEVGENLSVVERDHYVGAGGLGSKLRESLAIARSMLRANADVYILRCFGLHLPVGVLFAKVFRRRAIISGSNDIDFIPSAHGCSPLVEKVYRWAFRWADLIVCQTDQQAEVAGREYPGKRRVVVRSFGERAEVSNLEPEAFLWVGRLVDYKRPLAYIELARRLPEQKFRMVYVESSETPARLHDEVHAAGASVPNLELIEPIPRDDLLDLIARSYAIVLTSEAEGMPNVFLEAWTRGIPALSLGFDPDNVISGEQAGLVAEDDIDGFAEAARRLVDDPDLRETMGRNGRAYLLARHSPDRVLDGWEAAIDSLQA